MPRRPVSRHSTPARPPLRDLQPAPPRPLVVSSPPPPAEPPPETSSGTSFLSLPAEIRVQIYELVLATVTVHIIPIGSDDNHYPHALLRTSRQIRDEVQPLIRSACPIQATITDFDFSGLLTWMMRIPSDHQNDLVKNPRLNIALCTTLKVPGDLPTLRKWLHDRADHCRPQPQWKYTGPRPNSKVASDLRRRARRMKEEGKKVELVRMLKGIGVGLHDFGSDDD